MATVFDLIFRTILQIDPSTISRYTSLQDQILYLLFIPHIIIFIFLFWFAFAVMPAHRGLRYLVSIGAYIFLILGGWYGKFLVSIFIVWWQILLVVALIFFIGSRFIRPSAIKEIFEMGKGLGKKVTEKGKKGDQLEKEIRSLTRQIETLEIDYPDTAERPRPRSVQIEITELKRRKVEKQQELADL